MPVGEDIPMLIPISIVLVIFIIFLVTLISNFSEQTEIVKLAQVSTNIGDYLLNNHPNLSLGRARLNGTWLETHGYEKSRCATKTCNISDIGLLVNTSARISVRIETADACWCWSEVNGEQRITNSFPALIINNSKTIPAKVVVSVVG
jgi:hypothetical protein